MPRKPGPDHKLEPFYSSGCPPKNAAQHGTLTMYQRHACRCRECKLAQQAYSRRRRADYHASVDTEAYLATLRAKAKAESARAAEIAQAKADWDEARVRSASAPLVDTGFDEL